MSVKEVKDYYYQICQDYKEMVDNLKDMEEELNNKVISPDKVEQLKQMITPIKDNYERISYIMFLLDMPTKKEKQERYKNQQKKKVYPNADLKSIRDENSKIINDMKF